LLASVVLVAFGGIVTPVAGAPEPRVQWLEAVSCPTAMLCFAVGPTTQPRAAALVMRWTGTTWSVVSVPIASDLRWVTLNGISCASANRCVAIGKAQRGKSSSDTYPFVANWNGTKWTSKLLSIKAMNWTFSAISCAAASSCVAVGYVRFHLSRHPVALHWNGSKWSLLGVPRTQGVSLYDVSCPAPGTCVAIGSAGYALRWNGSGWSKMAIPKASGVKPFVDDIDCPTTKLCRAVGARAPKGDSLQSQAAVISWNGSNGSVAHVATRRPSELSGISCLSATSCVAVGYSHAQHTTRTFTEKWNGTAWSETPSPNTADARTFLTDVSCASATNCHAVGFGALEDGSSNQLFALRWNGTNWTRTL
jgi:hypothetical protein